MTLIIAVCDWVHVLQRSCVHSTLRGALVTQAYGFPSIHASAAGSEAVQFATPLEFDAGQYYPRPLSRHCSENAESLANQARFSLCSATIPDAHWFCSVVGLLMEYDVPAAVLRSTSAMMYEVYQGNPTADSLDICREVCCKTNVTPGWVVEIVLVSFFRHGSLLTCNVHAMLVFLNACVWRRWRAQISRYFKLPWKA